MTPERDPDFPADHALIPNEEHRALLRDRARLDWLFALTTSGILVDSKGGWLSFGSRDMIDAAMTAANPSSKNK